MTALRGWPTLGHGVSQLGGPDRKRRGEAGGRGKQQCRLRCLKNAETSAQNVGRPEPWLCAEASEPVLDAATGRPPGGSEPEPPLRPPGLPSRPPPLPPRCRKLTRSITPSCRVSHGVHVLLTCVLTGTCGYFTYRPARAMHSRCAVVDQCVPRTAASAGNWPGSSLQSRLLPSHLWPARLLVPSLGRHPGSPCGSHVPRAPTRAVDPATHPSRAGPSPHSTPPPVRSQWEEGGNEFPSERAQNFKRFQAQTTQRGAAGCSCPRGRQAGITALPAPRDHGPGEERVSTKTPDVTSLSARTGALRGAGTRPPVDTDVGDSAYFSDDREIDSEAGRVLHAS